MATPWPRLAAATLWLAAGACDDGSAPAPRADATPVVDGSAAVDGAPEALDSGPPAADAQVDDAAPAGDAADPLDAHPPDAARPAATPDAALPPPPAPTCGDGVLDPGEFCPEPRYHYPSGDGVPVRVRAVDLNGDGRAELIEPRLWSGVLAVRPGTRILERPVAQALATGVEGISDVAVGDVDGDGDLDLVLADLLGRSLVVCPQGPDGRFMVGATVPLAGQPFTVHGGDLDGDGRFDVVVADFDRGGAALFFGQADGGLGRAAFVPTGVEPHGAVAADVDGDGHLDLVVANAGTHDPAPDRVTVSWGRGDGTFSAPTALTVGNGPFHVGVGDLNGDGRADVVAGNFGTPVRGADYVGGDSVSVLLNLGGRRFAAAVEHPAGDGPNHLTLADVDRDGHLDVVTADRGNFDFGRRRAVGGGTLTVLFGDGAGGFRHRAALDLGASATGVDVADLNGDGALDLVGAVHDGGYLAVFFQDP